MKIRNGFVSNSSSSSFVINKHFLSQDKIDKIKNHIKYSNELDETYKEYKRIDDDGEETEFWEPFYAETCDAWNITEDGKSIRGFTIIDNFDMYRFLEKIGIPKHVVKREDY